MTIRRIHRVIGVAMTLPLLAWAVTGFIFFVKPGYGDAYASIAVKSYPLDAPVSIAPRPDWLEMRALKTALGPHLLARTADGWKEYDPATLSPRDPPDDAALRTLLDDACVNNTQRFGHIAGIERSADGIEAVTTTGIRLSLDWDSLALSQRGADTDRIDFLYRIHYLQWTGFELLDRVLGFAGIVFVIALSLLGVRLFFRA